MSVEKIQLLPCPFCGENAGYHDHSYSDDYCTVGCINPSCLVKPLTAVSPEYKPWTKAESTYEILWEEAELEAAQNWNTRKIQDLKTGEQMNKGYEVFRAEFWRDVYIACIKELSSRDIDTAASTASYVADEAVKQLDTRFKDKVAPRLNTCEH